MTWPACGAETAVESAGTGPGAAPGGDGLRLRVTADGSPSLWSERFGEGFHSSQGALAEARSKFVQPAQLERFAPGRLLRVVDVGVGLGYNSAALLEAARSRGLRLQWWGLENDPRPLAWALAEPGYRSLWQPATLRLLEQLRDHGQWHGGDPGGGNDPGCEGRWLPGDARHRLPQLLQELAGCCDLILHDAFSPGRCPELWSLEFLQGLARLLAPHGRLLTYCSAAAVRQGLRLAGLELAAIQELIPAAVPAGAWSLGTAASPEPLPQAGPLRELSSLEWEHLASRAAEPYRDPHGTAAAAEILAARRQAQASSAAESSSAWRRRWGLG